MCSGGVKLWPAWGFFFSSLGGATGWGRDCNNSCCRTLFHVKKKLQTGIVTTLILLPEELLFICFPSEPTFCDLSKSLLFFFVASTCTFSCCNHFTSISSSNNKISPLCAIYKDERQALPNCTAYWLRFTVQLDVQLPGWKSFPVLVLEGIVKWYTALADVHKKKTSADNGSVSRWKRVSWVVQLRCGTTICSANNLQPTTYLFYTLPLTRCRTPNGSTGGSGVWALGEDMPDFASHQLTRVGRTRIAPPDDLSRAQLQLFISTCLGLSIEQTKQTNRPWGAYHWLRLPHRPNTEDNSSQLEGG